MARTSAAPLVRLVPTSRDFWVRERAGHYTRTSGTTNSQSITRQPSWERSRWTGFSCKTGRVFGSTAREVAQVLETAYRWG